MISPALAKQLEASETLKRLARKSGNGQALAPAPAPGCEVKLDRQQFYCVQNPTAALMANPAFKSLTAHRVARPHGGRFQAFGRAHWFQRTRSRMKVLIESERREAWLPPYRVTMYADDRTGLLPTEVFSVLEVLPDFRLTMMELAVDFHPVQMNRKFVREQALFGKSRPVPSVNGTDYYGTRRGTKRVQAYLKEI
jgi:hypothetical protein